MLIPELFGCKALGYLEKWEFSFQYQGLRKILDTAGSTHIFVAVF
jgi:hypothetical protein